MSHPRQRVTFFLSITTSPLVPALTIYPSPNAPQRHTHTRRQSRLLLIPSTPSPARALTARMPYIPPRPVRPPVDTADPALGSTAPPPHPSPLRVTRIPFPERSTPPTEPIPQQTPADTSPSSSTPPPSTEVKDLPTPRPPRTSAPVSPSLQLDLTTSIAELAISPQLKTAGIQSVVASPSPLMTEGGTGCDVATPLDPSSESDLPSLSHSHDTPSQASSTSIASLSSDNQDSTTASIVLGDGMMSPATSVSEQPDLDDAVARYQEGLYAYTRGLYIEAKISSSRAERYRQTGGNQFAAKQSGMEKMTAKKALARRLKE